MNAAHARAVALAVPAASVGILGWSGFVLPMCALPLFVWSWARSPNRRAALFVSLAYYLACSRGLIVGGAAFFSAKDASPNWLAGLAVWCLPSILMACVWALCWSPRNNVWRSLIAIVVLAIPPIGIVGWANPIGAAGALFPGWGWIGLGLMAVTIASCASRMALIVLPLMLCCAITANGTYVAPAEPNMLSVDTANGRGETAGDSYAELRSLQSTVLHSSERAPTGAVLILPELQGGDWSLNEMWWDSVAQVLADRKQTALIGARKTIEGSANFVNGLFAIGTHHDAKYIQRVPVPVGMWKPWSAVSAAAPLSGSGVTTVGSLRIGVLVCYEQLLGWPVLQTLFQRPDVLAGTSNSWWAAGTSIPAIQRQSIIVWARLFRIPAIYSENM